MNMASLLTDTVTYQTVTGVSSSGDRTWSAQTTISARVESGSRLVVLPSGEQRKAQLSIVTAAALPLDCRLWVPGDTTSNYGAAKRPLAVARATSPDGYTIYETFV